MQGKSIVQGFTHSPYKRVLPQSTVCFFSYSIVFSEAVALLDVGGSNFCSRERSLSRSYLPTRTHCVCSKESFFLNTCGQDLSMFLSVGVLDPILRVSVLIQYPPHLFIVKVPSSIDSFLSGFRKA